MLSQPPNRIGGSDNMGETVSQRPLSKEQVRNIVRDLEAGLKATEILHKYDLDEPKVQQRNDSREQPTLSALQDENRDLKRLLDALLPEARTRLQERGHEHEPRMRRSLPDQSPAVVRAGSGLAGSRESVRSLLERSRIIPAIRGPEYIPAAIASPTVIVWLLYGTPLTLGDIVRQVRSAGKLPVANLDLLTGFAQDADAVELLAAQGIAGVVSTRQSVLRAARAQGIIAVQRTFVVDSIAVGNITRSLQHFIPDAIELLPAAAAPLCLSALQSTQPELPVIATGLVTTMRQVEELTHFGVCSIATSDVSLWIL